MNDRVTDSFESVIVISHLTQQREAKFAWKNSSPKYQRRPTSARRQPKWVFSYLVSTGPEIFYPSRELRLQPLI